MLSRGALGLASSRTRRAFALSWSVLFILSLLLQYATFALAPAALAVHDDGAFELDGNALASAAPGDDWNSLGSADTNTFIHEAPDSTIFTTGGSKDDLNTTSWRWTDGSVPDKDDLLDGFAALYNKTLYFGADRFANNGDSAIGFWFFQNGLSVNANGTFSPAHKVGDLFVVSHFENGGAASEIQLYTWVGSGGSDGALDLTATGQICTTAPAADKACGIANATATDAPWSYTPKAGAAGTFPQFSFFEGGLDLAKVFTGTVPCFGSFLVETRSSQEVNAQLKDFIAGDFNTCVPPTIATTASATTVQLGGTVTDTANLSGSDGKASGSIKFFVCGPNASATACSSGGTQVGGAVAVDTSTSVGTATSAAFTPPAAGFYCFRAEYTPDADSQYLVGSHTNATTECFKVVEAHIAITKTADPVGPVNAGDTIGFNITVTNEGDGTALGVHVTDVLPAGISWSAGAPTGDITGVSCGIVAGTLTCDDASMAAGDSFTVHVSGATDAADCGTVNNTASVTSTNDGSDGASASVVVLCADIAITKAANPAGPVNAGDPIGFDITVSNSGAGEAKGVHVFDPLPAGVDWTLGAVTGDVTGVVCSITGAVDSEILTCDDPSMASGDSFSVRITSVMNEACATIDNTATVTTTNDGSDEASASVGCSALFINKSIATNLPTDPDLPGVPQAKIGGTVTYKLAYTGGGVLTDAFIVDVLPIGLDYKTGTASSNTDFAFTNATFNTTTKQWTLRWDATGVLPNPVSGFVTYDVVVLAAAAEQPQPLENLATIDSNETPPDSDTQNISVAPPPEALTPPPTDTFTPQMGTSNPGFALMLVLLGVAAVTLSIGFVTPVPARMTRRDRRG